MQDIKEQIASSQQLSQLITSTASDVNKKSLERKKITAVSRTVLEQLINRNDTMIANFETVLTNLQDSQRAISSNSDSIISNKDILSSIIERLVTVGGELAQMEQEIEKLTEIVDEIKGDTNKIFSLALNASIVSSKYSNTSGVFDILANKLNEMSNFINQNLEIIVSVVRPITEGVQKLIKANESVLHEIGEGTKSLDELNSVLGKQVESIKELFDRADISGKEIKEQKQMLNDVNQMIIQMDSDAQQSIQGSSNVTDLAKNLQEEVTHFLSIHNYNDDFIDRVNITKEKAQHIWQNAENVNLKSKNQLQFSKNCEEFNEKIIKESIQLQETAEIMNKQTGENSKVSEDISANLTRLTRQIGDIETNMNDSGRTIQKFNDDYKQIDNILEFLKNILKSMHLIGMYSRIESARDTEEFAGFMNISSNITNLQKEIQNNIPVIEKNINDTHQLIDSVNSAFKHISADFDIISGSSNQIIAQLEDIVTTNRKTETTSSSMLENSTQIITLLNSLDNHLSELSTVVEFPIEGSSKNVERGKQIEDIFNEIIKQVQMMETPGV
ncbi:MAG: methyl-accepting chemotaxis protein [Spirochaetes bacterium]|jgi:methyl-accepting chemotaxis protein|nr:methyl-accepting chemotaxis protein [Spirochaetota bacterium]